MIAKFSKSWQKSFPKPPKTLPKPSPNPPKSKRTESPATKTTKVETKLLSLNDGHPLGPHFGCPRPAKRGPRGSQNLPKWSPKRKKIDVKKQVDFRLDFFMVWAWFFMVFSTIFCRNKLLKWRKNIFAKTWKIEIFFRENWYFQCFKALKLKWASFKK